MAIFLIKDSDATHADKEKDACCYKRGDVVQVFDDDKPCVIPPAPPFLIVQVEGLSFLDALKYMEPDNETITGDDGVLVAKMKKRRAHQIDFDSLTVNHKNSLESNRYAKIKWANMKNSIVKKSTGEREK